MNRTTVSETSAVGLGILDVTSYSLGDQSRTSEAGLDESDFCDESVLQLMDKPFSQLVDGMQLRKNDRYSGFDNNAGDSWIYPTNYPVRKYQFSITKAALFKNTLVVLPTGLGKTFIAAVVMYNIYRWYPTGKIIFMAPTRPLVNQQIDACYKIMGIPKIDTAEMTGKQQKKNRIGLWQTKRVFYVTPQVVQADINSPEQNFPTNQIKLIVIDEAHKAKGRYAYAEVIKAVSATNKNFRVLALSATPGRTLEDVAEVIQNLLITHIEVRWENSIDVSPYSFKKNIRTVVIPLGAKIIKVRDEYIQIIDPYVRRLLDANVISGHLGSLSRGWLIMEQKRFREACLINRHRDFTSINSDFSACISLYHALELLIRHGIRAFLNFFEDENNSTQEKYFVAKDLRLKWFLNELREEYGRNPLAIFNAVGAMPNGVVPKIADDEGIDFGHPKFNILERNLREHFQNNPDSKVIIFCEFRDSVAMIHRLLLQNRPLIKPKCIVGQGGTAGGLRAVSQKEQIAAMKDFRSGVCNTLIATCVAEEGIDVGEVDLIVCFDITKNPVRFVQRIGRTGRQRVGRVLMLVTEGKEHDTLKEVMASKDKTNQKLSRSKEILSVLYRHSPRLVPTEFDPKCVETFIKVPEENVEVAANAAGRGEKKGRKRKIVDEQPDADVQNDVEPKEPRKRKRGQDAVQGTQDLRNFFRKTTDDLDASEREIFASPVKNNTSTESVNTSRDRIQVPTDAAIRLGKTEQEQALENLVKPLLRHKARLERGKFLNDNKLLTLKEDNPYSSTICPHPLKRLFLEANIDNLKRMVEVSEVLQAAVGDEESQDVIMLDDQGECVKSQVQVIEGIFGGRGTLKQRIADIDEYRNITNVQPVKKNQKHAHRENISAEHIAKYNEYFEKFSNHKLQGKNIKDSSIRLRTVPSPPTPTIDRSSTSNLFDSQFYLPSILEPEESRYQPPIHQSPLRSTKATPMNRTKSKSRISTLTKTEKRTPDYANSPLLRAFNRSIQKAKNSDYASPVTSRPQQLNFRMVLEYFGLKSIEDIFEEPESQKKPENHFLNRLEAVAEEGEATAMEGNLAEQIAEISRNLFDSRGPNQEATEPTIVINNSSQEDEVQPIKAEDSIIRREVEMLEADFVEGDFSAMEVPQIPSSSRKLSVVETQREIPLSEFLRDNFPDDESQIMLTGSERQKKELDLDIQSCLLDLAEEEPMLPDSTKTDSEEVIPNSQEQHTSHKSQPKPSFKNLDIGNIEDLFADSDDDLFGNSEGSKKSSDPNPLPEVPEDKSSSNNISQKENAQIESNRQFVPTTPKTNAQALPVRIEKSPELLRKKLNFTRLRLAKASTITTDLEVNSAPVERHSFSSPFFASCRPPEKPPVVELERRFSFQRSKTPLENKSVADLSVIAPRAKRRALVSSESEEETFQQTSQHSSVNDDDDDDVFQTARTTMGPPPSYRSTDWKQKQIVSAVGNGFRRKRLKRNNGCGFLLSQAEVSDDDEEDGAEEDGEDDVLSELIDDSIVDHGPIEEDAVDMRAKYLQSVRSPPARGKFKIPSAPVRHMNLSDIYSQLPTQHEQQSMYEDCSFIVHDDDAEGSGNSEPDELERAEAILRERRRAKKLQRDAPKAKRRRKIISLGNSSEDSSDEGEEVKAFRKQINSLPG